MAEGTIRITRNQLAKFITDHDTLKQFEVLFEIVKELEATVADHEDRLVVLEP